MTNRYLLLYLRVPVKQHRCCNSVCSQTIWFHRTLYRHRVSVRMTGTKHRMNPERQDWMASVEEGRWQRCFLLF